MRILSIDTSQPRGSASVSVDGRSETVTFGVDSSHLIELGKAVAELLQRVNTDIADIERIAYVSGPGSFTGLRIGLAYVKGFYAALGLEVVSMSSLELLAAGAIHGHERVCSMIDARRDEVYAEAFAADGGYDAKDGQSPPRVRSTIAPQAVSAQGFVGMLEIAPTVFTGSGAMLYRSVVESRFGSAATFVDGDADHGSTELLCRISPWLSPLSAEDILLSEPFYIRPSDAKLKPLREIRVHD